MYEDLLDIHDDNTSEALLKQLSHEYDTQWVEVMNKSCSSFIQKGEIFYKTMSLTTRLQVACAAKVIGHRVLWERIFQSTGVGLGPEFNRYLKIKDKEKCQRHAYTKTKKYKVDRRKNWNNKYKILREKQMEISSTAIVARQV